MNNPPKISLFNATTLVMGLVVGSGIFVSSADMARRVPSAPWLLGLWLLTGVVTLAGALSQCELVGQMPGMGGPYEYFKKVYGDSWGFLYGWANFVIAGSGAIAAIAFTFSNYLNEVVLLPRLSPALEHVGFKVWGLGTFYPGADFGTKLVASALIIGLTWINIKGLKLGAGVQAASLIAKLVAIGGLIIVAFWFSGQVGHASNWLSRNPAAEPTSSFAFMGVLALAMGSAFWSYDGWGAISYMSAEVRNPTRNVPRSIIYGCAGFITLYFVINLAYLYVLPLAELGAASQDRVAATMVQKIFGPSGGVWIALLVMLSTFDTTNATILTNGRVYYAMAMDGLFHKSAGRLHAKAQTPHISLAYQGIWSLVLLWTGSFDIIMSMYIFVNWVLYVLIGVAVFVLRYRNRNLSDKAQAELRPFSCPGYPWVPGFFILFATGFVVMTVAGDYREFVTGVQPVFKSLVGLALVLAGMPFYWLLKKKVSFKR